MFSKLGLFALGFCLSASSEVLSRPLQSEANPIKPRHVVKARVVARDAFANSSSNSTQTPRTVIFSGTATATPVPGAITVQFGFFAPTASSGSPNATVAPTATESVVSTSVSSGASTAAASSSTSSAGSVSATVPASSTDPAQASSPAYSADSDDSPTTTSATASAAGGAAGSSTTTAPPQASSSQPFASKNLQVFTGNLGGVDAPAVYSSGNQFQVVGNNVFKTEADALSRSCDLQLNACADAANKSGDKGDFTVNACNGQKTQCISANGT